ncbi:hypothetical protein CTAM01_14388 [Colletotrichum tamarilloi]|uniref:Uncharacterized protein n=1 Tax=Colletotrichum tamarilloi TaxID=1209934 RepID=A0ABQ9QPD7_9PEZI|nr:uncharacterized protein CTAM01_14388 [Colletotrichum tamarilloi]KAK1480446.1 hypothetical protein CTAM01_14388 [Colletotrichum tamarilloi]
MDVSKNELHLLGLPLEVRLQIYGWVHVAHPVEHAQLAPWYPNPIHSAYFLRPVNPPGVETEDCAVPGKIVKAIGQPAGEEDDSDRDQKSEEPSLLSPNRPISGIPSALLETNRQIYNECRSYPFHTNEFVFVNWFSSGLWAARAFTRGLRPWQRDEMRWARLEMLGRDFTGPALKEWIELCEHWSFGLRGLRLKVLIGGGIFEPTAPFSALKNNAEAQAMGLGSKTTRPDPRPEWIEEGLRKLRALRRLEVELSVLDWGDGEKLEWCAELGKMLNVDSCVLVKEITYIPLKEHRENLTFTSTTHKISVKMNGHIMRGRFHPHCPEFSIDYSTAWSPEVRIPVLILITLFLMSMNPTVADIIKGTVWMVVKPIALLIGYLSVAIIRILIFLFIDGPKMITILITPDRRDSVDFLGIDVENNTKLNAIWSRLHTEEEWVPGGVFDKKYKPFLPARNMKMAGPRQKKVMTRDRGLSC